MVHVTGIILFWLGALISCTNFYLSFVRPLPHHCGSKSGTTYPAVSGIPLFGSALLGVAAIILWGSTCWVVASVLIAIIDTGGLHWFLATLLWHEVLRPRLKKRSHHQ